MLTARTFSAFFFSHLNFFRLKQTSFEFDMTLKILEKLLKVNHVGRGGGGCRGPGGTTEGTKFRESMNR